MADYYINPDYTGGGSDGSLSAPWTSWTDVTFASNNNYYQKAGTTDIRSAKMLIVALTNINIGMYGVGAKPIIKLYIESTLTGDWVDQGGNVWMYDSTLEFSKPHVLLGLGSLGNRITPSWTKRIDHIAQGGGRSVLSFSEFGQWDANVGAVADSAKLYIYSDANPVTKWGTVYYTTLSDNIFQVRNGSTNINIDSIHGMYGGSVVNNYGNGLINVNVTSTNCISEHSYYGFSLGGASGEQTDCSVNNCEIYRAGSVGIRINGTMNTGNTIHTNDITDTGGCDCIGAIYGAPTSTDKLLIHNNTIDTVTEDPYWANEGYALYSEHAATGIKWNKNYVSGCADRAGIHTNGGVDRVEYIGNLIANCKEMFNGSDSNEHRTDNYSLYSNTGYNLRNGFTFNRASSLGTMTAFVKNNICYSDGTGGTDLLIDVDTAGIADSVDEDYNCYYGFGTVNNAGVNNITTDPLFNSITDYNLQSTSPCVGTGVQHWGTDPRPDTLGEPLPDRDIDLGAYQSTWSPNHPKNI